MPRPAQRSKLTTRILEALPAGAIIRDSAVVGLFAERLESGVALKVQADWRPGTRTGKARDRKTIKVTLGRWPALTLDAARAEAMRLLAEVKAGRDPRLSTASAGAPTVGKLYAEWLADLRQRGKAERTASDAQARYDRYLSAWAELPVATITRAMARDEHARITREHGPVVANDTLRNFRAAYNWARKAWDAPLGDNPAEAVAYNQQRARKDVLTFPDLPGWLARCRALENPLRAVMHELGLFSGLRPGALVALERSWVRLEAKAVEIPAGRMKARRPFALPLSGHMIGLVQRALEVSATMYPSAPYLFPTRSTDGRRVIATQVWKERTLPSETGHVLRHMYSNAAQMAGVASVDRMLLLAQKVPGVEGLYLQERALFERLLAEQERVSAYLIAQTRPSPK